MSLVKVKLVSSSISEEKISQAGNSYKIATISFLTKDGSQSANMYCSLKKHRKALETVEMWLDGDEVKIVLEQVNDYVNFSLPTRLDLLEERVEILEKARG